jgi:hypothetical protein
MPGLKISHSLLPLRLSTKGPDNTADLTITVHNISDDEKIVSVDINILSKGLLGFDRTMVHKKATKNLVSVPPHGDASFTARLYCNPQTEQGSYSMQIIAFDHYLDFDKVLDKTSKTFDIRVV